jgi:hypothetical protein
MDPFLTWCLEAACILGGGAAVVAIVLMRRELVERTEGRAADALEAIPPAVRAALEEFSRTRDLMAALRGELSWHREKRERESAPAPAASPEGEVQTPPTPWEVIVCDRLTALETAARVPDDIEAFLAMLRNLRGRVTAIERKLAVPKPAQKGRTK